MKTGIKYSFFYLNSVIRKVVCALILGVVFSIFFFATGVCAATPTDEILNYYIVADVNEDATVNFTYHIDWEVLESDSAGPLTWVKVGIPNRHNNSVLALSDTISDISIMGGGESFVRIDFDRSYYEGEVVSFDFAIEQDNMYQINKTTEGYTEYTFTPGWFDDIKVDNIVIRWNVDKVDSWSPYSSVDDGYLEWVNSLYPGEKMTVTISYPNDAYAFDFSKSEAASDSDDENIIVTIISLIMMLVMAIFPLAIPFAIVLGVKNYINNTGFGTPKTKKITRTRVEFYPSCPGCGAVRKEGQEKCEYCGHSFIKSEETITEDEVKNEKELQGLNKDGIYRNSSSPNSYIRVHTVYVPTPRPVRSGGGRGGSHSSCAHSSCACACACACAGGGRAGCSSKDFYNTGLKLRKIKKYNNKFFRS